MISCAPGQRRYLDIGVNDPDRAAALLRERMGIDSVERTAEGAVRLFEGLDHSAEVARILVGAGLDLHYLVPAQEDLESYFMRLTGGQK